MIKLNKSASPAVLTNNAASWLTELQSAIASNDKNAIAYRKSRYNHADIKSAVIAETYGKCAYCEAKVLAVAHGDIEHIFPKSRDVSKTFDWSNLGFACQLCNQSKSDKDPHAEQIIDPYTVDPEPYISFFCAMINGNDTAEGLNTINHLDLKRADLAERRGSVIQSLIKSITAMKRARSPEEKAALIADFEANELGPHLEFSAMRRDFWRAFNPS
ncbi:HNH endonuclease [Rhizobium sp. LCM 4573]|uniref:HNH endonuclease n=1 Tax=Rhizobium sp. LCM 4573 TaxID=1848291 RepID=UPI0008DAC193|nr:HNH endonuclease [Rhizobium sp. LCM 4573]OHV84664.1 hypothetical protein LCM4573_03130 [Rhizobium sp. LCM 4573]